jgi:hypothetical protein
VALVIALDGEDADVRAVAVGQGFSWVAMLIG